MFPGFLLKNNKEEEVMKRRSWIGFLVGVVFCLLMVLPSFVHADVTISGGTESSYVDLEGINDGSVPPVRLLHRAVQP